jgi:hypothetical protein
MTDPEWLARMHSVVGTCDECGTTGHHTVCRKCALAGACHACGAPLLEAGPCSDDPQHTTGGNSHA